MYKRILALSVISLLLMMSGSGCTPLRKPVEPLPELPPNTNRAPLPHNAAENAQGLIGTANQTPGIQHAWGVVHHTTLILGVKLESWVSASNEKRIKLAAVARVLDATNQLIIVKITSDPEQVAKIRTINQAVQQGKKYSAYAQQIKALDTAIPAIDQQRPR